MFIKAANIRDWDVLADATHEILVIHIEPILPGHGTVWESTHRMWWLGLKGYKNSKSSRIIGPWYCGPLIIGWERKESP